MSFHTCYSCICYLLRILVHIHVHLIFAYLPCLPTVIYICILLLLISLACLLSYTCASYIYWGLCFDESLCICMVSTVIYIYLYLFVTPTLNWFGELPWTVLMIKILAQVSLKRSIKNFPIHQEEKHVFLVSTLEFFFWLSFLLHLLSFKWSNRRNSIGRKSLFLFYYIIYFKTLKRKLFFPSKSCIMCVLQK